MTDTERLTEREFINSVGESNAAISESAIEDTTEWLKARVVFGFMAFLGLANVYAMRVNLSVAIVAMVNATKSPISNRTLDVCDIKPPDIPSIPDKPGEFNWDESQQGIVLGCFFYGYVITQVPGGRLAELYSAKVVFGLGILFTSIFTLLSPPAAYINYYLFIFVRVLEGIAEGVTYPAIYVMLSRWIPPLERSKYGAYVCAGSNFGTVLSLPISGWLCNRDFLGGWPLCFYLFGSLGIIWYVFWVILIFDEPINHPRISQKELEYITHSIGIPREEDNNQKLPWMKLFTCLPLWAILVTQCGSSWLFYTQLTELPTYMANILHFNIEQNAMLSALPYFTSWVGGILLCSFAKWLLERDAMSRVHSLKFWNSIAVMLPSLGILGVAWVGCDKTAVVMLLAISNIFFGAVYAGAQMNHIDLSPKYAGTMYGITNTAGNVCGFVAPYVIGSLINGQETLGNWRTVFYLGAAINMAANLFYLAFASAERVVWSDNASNTEQAEGTEKDSIDYVDPNDY